SICANDLKIEAVGNYTFYGVAGDRFEAPVYLPEFGSAKGTLLFLPNSDSVAIDAAHDCGFYLSIIDPSKYDYYDAKFFKETLIDFTWKSERKSAPLWYIKG